jgi:ABC-type transport system involved in multi-copper enzyme maturation permease subunit
MWSAFRSEIVRLRRPRLLFGWFGLTALCALMTSQVMFGVVAEGTAPKNGPGVVFPTLEILTSAKGIVAGLSMSSSMFGVITLSFWAIAVATDYSTGLMRLLVSAQPRRWKLLGGKVLALAILTAVATTVATLVTVAAAVPAAQSAGVSTAAWGSDLGAVVLGAWINCYGTLLVWGIIGLTLAGVTRSSAIAISIGAGYVLLAESLVRQAFGDASSWLLGSTLSALAAGGNEVLPYRQAGAMGLVYAGAGLTIALVVFTLRDVTD